MSPIQVAVIGAGPAGMAAALAAADAGADDVLLIERDDEAGGILNQCVHDGFGNLIFGESLTGPEYAHRFMEEIKRRSRIRLLTGTMVLNLHSDGSLKAVNRSGAFSLKPGAVVLAMGCRERSRFQAVIPGYRPAGIYTAGAAQRLINIEGLMPGEKAVILGSGDIGLIMARRLILEGAQVCGVFEILPRPGGLTRNVVQCLHDFNIPLHLSHTVTFIHGKKRLTGVSVAPVDEQGQPLLERERFIPCDTLILSVGLIPENELSRAAGVIIDEATRGPRVDQDMATSVPGIFAGGNVVQVYDLVDHVSRAAAIAGRSAALYAAGYRRVGGRLLLQRGENVSAMVPQQLSLPLAAGERINLYLRTATEMRGAAVELRHGEKVLYRKKMRIVRPPEMIHLELEASLFAGLGGGDALTCRVAAEEVKQK
ncbi:MAG: FAD-dependent oxidoreductase [Firmicutes bacterium]|jgi:NADPH-dependent 2,4-dienoyl-CoA reductase/sulfur reductase-like enzyme|nr:FAD-dependent oxidoreductase [Bacillota bacterium]HPU00685.1 FAD-dependent oxidoreductase [Bacillota bacterium]